jgi:hypothetical protein
MKTGGTLGGSLIEMKPYIVAAAALALVAITTMRNHRRSELGDVAESNEYSGHLRPLIGVNRSEKQQRGW